MQGAVLLSLVKNLLGQLFDLEVVFKHLQNLDNEMLSQLLWNTAILSRKRQEQHLLATSIVQHARRNISEQHLLVQNQFYNRYANKRSH